MAGLVGEEEDGSPVWRTGVSGERDLLGVEEGDWVGVGWGWRVDTNSSSVTVAVGSAAYEELIAA